MTTIMACSIEGCDKPVSCRGWCSGHYHRWQRHGDPLAGNPAHQTGLLWLKANKIHEDAGCLVWPFYRRKDGRAGAIMFRGKQIPAARVMCILVHGDPPTPKSLAAHECGKAHEGCVHPRHLHWATSQENQADRLRDGTHNRGERHPNVRLTEDQVLEIREMAKSDPRMTHAAIGDKFDTNGKHIRLVVLRRTWAWL